MEFLLHVLNWLLWLSPSPGWEVLTPFWPMRCAKRSGLLGKFLFLLTRRSRKNWSSSFLDIVTSSRDTWTNCRPRGDDDMGGKPKSYEWQNIKVENIWILDDVVSHWMNQLQRALPLNFLLSKCPYLSHNKLSFLLLGAENIFTDTTVHSLGVIHSHQYSVSVS